MALLEEAKALTKTAGGSCPVAVLAESDPKLHAELVEAMASDVTHAGIERALKQRGVTIKQLSIGRHRNGDCKCR